jgi:flagellar protein FliJ
MKKFEFSLAALLKLRKKKEELAQTRLLKAEQIFTQEKIQLARLLKEFNTTCQEIRKLHVSSSKANTLEQMYQYLTNLKNKIYKQKEITLEAKYIVEAKRSMLIAAINNRKILENLKEKKLAEWTYEAFNQERKFFDQIGAMQYSRKHPPL